MPKRLFETGDRVTVVANRLGLVRSFALHVSQFDVGIVEDYFNPFYKVSFENGRVYYLRTHQLQLRKKGILR